MEQNDYIDERLKGFLDNLEVQPGIQSFDAVMQKLEKEKKRRRGLLFFWSGACLLMLGVLALLLYSPVFAPISKLHIAQPGAPVSTSAKTRASSTPEAMPPDVDKNIPSQHKTALTKKRPSEKISATAEVAPEASVIKDNKPSFTHASSLHPLQPKGERSQNMLAEQAGSKTGHAIAASVPSAEKENLRNIEKEIPGKESPAAPSKAPAAQDTITPETGTPVAVVNNASTSDGTENYLPAKALFLSSFLQPELPQLQPVPTPSIIIPRRGKWQWYTGLSLNPQLSTTYISKNRHANPGYNTSAPRFSTFYENAKRNQRHLHFQYAFGLKEAIVLRDKYELTLGFGIQIHNEHLEYYVQDSVPPSLSNAIPQGAYAYDLESTGSRSFRLNYLYLSIGGARLLKLNRVFKLRLGMEAQANASSFRNFAQPAWWLHARPGIVMNAGRSIRIQLCPDFFYAPASVWDKAYVIRQNPYGVGLEASLLFRLF